MKPKNITELEKLWEKEAQKIPWFSRCTRVLDWREPHAHWFVGGQLNASYACLDVHIAAGRGDKIAYYYHNEQGDSREITYRELFILVNKLAAIFKTSAIKTGDIAIIYMPLSPEAIAVMLALARIGASHSVVFSGFSAAALRDRIQDAKSRFVVTSDYTMRRGKKIKLKEIVDEAVETLSNVKTVFIFERESGDQNQKNKGFDPLALSSFPRELGINPPQVETQVRRSLGEGGWASGTEDIQQSQVTLNNLLSSLPDNTYIDPISVESNHPLFILYTSGTTGKPKGIMHGTGGYLTYINRVFEWVFGINQETIYWCTADIGWITGHSFVVYAPLMHGITSIVYEGAPDFPSTQIWWQIIEKYRATIFYTSPTALRMFMRGSSEEITKHDLSSLQILGSVGEPINPEVWNWYKKTIGRNNCPIMDTWWQTETGGFMISPTIRDSTTHAEISGSERTLSTDTQKSQLLQKNACPNPLILSLSKDQAGQCRSKQNENASKDVVSQSIQKPGSAQFALPGIYPEILDEQGNPVPAGTKGHLVISQPWPGMTIGILNDPERFKQVYWSKYPGKYYTGDYAICDTDGYFWLLGRADEVLSIAGHRVGTAEIESAAVSHPSVAEAAAIGVPDEIKGEVVVLFVILKTHVLANANSEHAKSERVEESHIIRAGESSHMSESIQAQLKAEIIAQVRSHIGAFVTPKEIYCVEKLPKTRSGKIMRRVLKAIALGKPVGDLATLEDESSVEQAEQALQPPR